METEAKYMHQEIPDLFVTPLAIATILFVAWRIEWCVRHAWRLIRIMLIIAVVPAEILLIAAVPILGVPVAAVTMAFAVAMYTRFVERRAFEQEMERVKPEQEAWAAREKAQLEAESRRPYY
jgi:hypothetical protein